MDKDSLDKLYKKYYSQVKLYALTLCRDVQLAEDITAEAFYRALFSDAKCGESFKFWLLRVCRNLFYDHIRKAKKHVKLDENSAHDDGAERLIRREEYAALYRAVGLLEPSYREAVVLFYFEELHIKEISQITGWSEESVKVTLHRARHKLKQILE